MEEVDGKLIGSGEVDGKLIGSGWELVREVDGN